MRATRAMAGLALAAALTALLPGTAPAANPRNLEECYLRVALEKSTADLAYVAREICDAVFRRFPRPVTVRNPETGDCEEWWFDERGRYESAERHCALEATSAGTWRFACQSKRGSDFTFAELREAQGRYTPVDGVHGRDVGALFTGLTACVEARVEQERGAN